MNMNILLRILPSILLLSGCAHVMSTSGSRDNAQFTAMFDADQDGRKALQGIPPKEWPTAGKKLWEADAVRQRQLKEMLQAGQIKTAADYWHAAFIMQHGEAVDDIKLAFALGTMATVLAPETKKYRWITAASWDRILTYKHQPQWYGTQFIPDHKTGKQVQAPIAEGAVTDEERTALGVPTLQESEEMLREINGEKKP
jgi:hypothetical protein